MGTKATSIIKTLLIVTIVFGVLSICDMVSADDVVDEINITVPESCTMSGTGMDTHNANINNGTYTANIGTTTMHVFCNDNSGFAIYAAGYTGDQIGATDSNKLVGASTGLTIETGLATSTGNPDVSNWAMKLAITQDSGDTTGTNAFAIDSAPNVENGEAASFSQYHVVPNAYTKVAHKNTSTDMTAVTGGAKITSTYAAYISKTQPADTYSGQVIYTLVHPSTAATPIAPVNCNPSGTTLGTNNSTDIVCMQDVTSTNKSTILASMTENQQYTLTDKRDGKTYTVAKLEDGNIWMTQNLDLDLDSSKTYTNLDTDLGYNTTTGEYDTASWAPLRSTYQATSSQTTTWCNGGTWNSQDSYCEENYTPESYDPGNLYWNGIGSDNSDWEDYYGSCDFTTSTPSCSLPNPISTYTTVSGTPIPQYHLGNYYNWAAALATNDSSDYEQDDLVEQSICPAGWTLPRIGVSDDSFYALWDYYGLANQSYIDEDEDDTYDVGEDALWTSPLYYPASGVFLGVFSDIGYSGYSWSPIAFDTPLARLATFEVEGSAIPSGNTAQYVGSSIRCIARPVADSFTDGGDN